MPKKQGASECELRSIISVVRNITMLIIKILFHRTHDRIRSVIWQEENNIFLVFIYCKIKC